MTNPPDHEANGGEAFSDRHTYEDLSTLYGQLLEAPDHTGERVARVDMAPPAPLLSLMGRLLVRRERPRYTVTKVTDTTVSLPVLPANDDNSVRSGNLILEQGEEGTKLIFNISRTIYNPHPTSEMDHVGSAIDLDKKLDMESSTGPLEGVEGGRWYEYLSQVLKYRRTEQYREHGYGPFIEEHHDLIAAVEHEMGAQNPSK